MEVRKGNVEFGRMKSNKRAPQLKNLPQGSGLTSLTYGPEDTNVNNSSLTLFDLFFLLSFKLVACNSNIASGDPL